MDDIRTGNRILWFLHMVLQQLVAIIIGYVISILFDRDLNNLRLWHKVLTPLGVVLFMFEGIHIFSNYNHFSFGVRKTTLNNIHGYIMTVGLILMSVGVPFAIATNDAHFTSVHGRFGLATWILCLISGIVGTLANYSHNLKDYIRPIYLKFCHTLLGFSSLICAVAETILGFYNMKDEGPTTVPIIMVLVGVVSLAILIKSGITVLTHTKTVFTS